jgi:hypothetical protein
MVDRGDDSLSGRRVGLPVCDRVAITMLIFVMGALLGVLGGCTGTVKVPPPAPTPPTLRYGNHLT